MVNIFSTLKQYYKKPWVIGVTVVVLIIIFILIKTASKPTVEAMVVVNRTAVQEEVDVTGKVTAASAVDLSFEKSGKVVAVSKTVGDTVESGDTILRLDASDLNASRAQSVATLHYQEAKLSELLEGTRPEQLALSESKVKSAQSDLLTAQAAYITSLQTAYSSADDAIRGKTDEVFTNPRTNYPKTIFPLDDTQALSIQSGRVEVERRLTELQTFSSNIASTTSVEEMSVTIKRDLAEVKLFLDNLALVINNLPQNYFQTNQINVSQWRADLSVARTEVNTAITGILTAEDRRKQAETNLKNAQGQLTIEQSGTISQEIEAQEAQVAQARASVQAIDAQITKMTIKSPIDGIVTKQDGKIGQTVTPNTIVVSIINNGQYEIEANIAEADIAKVKVGQTSTVTLDAYSSDVVFNAVVVSIDPAETIVDGVPTYKTTFQFTQTDERIRSGMTANLTIVGDKRDNVLAVPERALYTKNGKRYVLVEQGKQKVETAVTTGLRGSDGLVEISSGLEEGQRVVVNPSS
jgi:HlyD family secretion protein